MLKLMSYKSCKQPVVFYVLIHAVISLWLLHHSVHFHCTNFHNERPYKEEDIVQYNSWDIQIVQNLRSIYYAGITAWNTFAIQHAVHLGLPSPL